MLFQVKRFKGSTFEVFQYFLLWDTYQGSFSSDTSSALKFCLSNVNVLNNFRTFCDIQILNNNSKCSAVFCFFSEEKEEPHSPVSGEHLVRPSSPAPVMGLPAEEPGPSTSVLTTETSAPVSPTTNHLSSRHRGSRRTLSQRRRQLPNHQGTMEDMLGVQRQIRDLLQDLNNTVATGFRDIAAAIRYVADKGSHT